MNIELMQAIAKGWEIFKNNIGAFILATLLAALLSLTVILLGPAMAGLFAMGLKAYRGESVSAGDVFAGFQNAGNNIILGFVFIAASLIGSFIPVVGSFIAAGLFIFLFPVALDKGLGVGEAINKSIQYFKSGWLQMIILAFVAGIIGGIGAVACAVGAIVTAPLGLLIIVAAYRQVEP